MRRVLATLKKEESAVLSLRKTLGSSFHEAVRLLYGRAGKIVVTGVGKSSFVAMKMSATLTSLGHTAFFLSPLDALHGGLGVIADGDVIIAISFSGESTELLKIIKHIKQSFSVAVVVITGNGSSSLCMLSDAVVSFEIKGEGSPHDLAPMASSTASLVLGDLLTVAITPGETFKKQEFAKLHPGGNLGLSLRTIAEIMTIGERVPVVSEQSLFIEALQVISDKGLGVVAVVSAAQKLLGVITDGDVRRILLKYENPRALLTRIVMTKAPKCVRTDTTLKAALETMELFKVTNLFVLDDTKRLVGIVHIHDLVEVSM